MQRHHFMEFFLRISDLKFKKNIASTNMECIIEMFKYVAPYLEKFD